MTFPPGRATWVDAVLAMSSTGRIRVVADDTARLGWGLSLALLTSAVFRSVPALVTVATTVISARLPTPIVPSEQSIVSAAFGCGCDTHCYRAARAAGLSTHRAKSAGPTLLPHKIVVTRRPANRSGCSRIAAIPSAADGSTTRP